jgi:hypothetical protein
VEPIIRHEIGTPDRDPHPARTVAGTFPTEWNAQQIAALAEALDRYLQWHQRQIQLNEERKFKRRLQ